MAIDFIFDNVEIRSWATKKDVYIGFSLFTFLLLFATVLSDIVHFAVMESTKYTTQNCSMAILVLHTMAFYLGILGFIYTTQSAGHSKLKAYLAVFGVLGNFAIFIMRLVIEVVFSKYRVEFYRLATESGK